jgi:Phage integrase, N-terminal SAM-like domain
MTATSATALVPLRPAFSDAERLALAGFLAGYRGLTRDAYALDLRQFTSWCRARSLSLFAVRRADVEGFARDLEARGRARATVTRRQCTIAGFCKYAVEEELLEHSPAARGWTTSRTPSRWDRNELGHAPPGRSTWPSASERTDGRTSVPGRRQPSKVWPGR